MKKLLFLLLLPVAINCMDAQKPAITFEGPQLACDQTEYEINAKDGIWSVGWIVYEYLDANTAEITLFSVDTELQNKGLGRTLFQKCVADIIAHNCTQICWTANPIIGTKDLETLRVIYQKLVNKLENSASYKLTSTDVIEDEKAKIKMVLTLNKNI